MLRLFACLLIVGCLVLPARSVHASDQHVACVQSQLTALGFDPGPVDGQSGPRTRGALRAYLATVQDPADQMAFDALPAFDNRAAVGWCREIGLRNPEAEALMPSAQPPQLFVGPGVHPDVAAHLLVAFRDAEAFLLREYGIRTASQVKIIAATTTDAWHTEIKKAGTMRQSGWADTRARGQRDCDTDFGLGASASRDGLSFCGPILALKEPALADLYYMVLSVTMTHELVHNVQRELSYDKVPRWVRNPDTVRRRMGPAWMVEGTAQVIEFAFLEQYYDRAGPGFAELRARALESELTLENIRRAREVRTAEAYDISTYAVQILVERFGKDSLFQFWRAVGETDNWYTAFEQTYGLTVQEFEALYPGMRDKVLTRMEFINDRDMNGDQILAHRPLTSEELQAD